MFNLFNPFIQSEIKMKFNMIRKFLNLINLHAIIILSDYKHHMKQNLHFEILSREG